MQDERKPDLGKPDDSAIEEKIRQMMDPKIKEPKPEESENLTSDTATAPEVVGLPTPKEPLKIKIIKPDPEDDELKEKPTSKNHKKITVRHDTEDAAPDEVTSEKESPVEPTEIAPEEVTTDEEQTPEEFDDQKTDEAVDDIAVHESDEVLASEDEKIAEAFRPPEKTSFGKKIKQFFSSWWHNPTARWLTLVGVFMIVVAVSLIPTSRYFLLNTAGVRSSLSLQVLDNSTQQPLKNVKVSIGEVSGLTGSDGKTVLSKVKLGPNSLTVEKRAFAPVRQSYTVGWGSNPLGQFKLAPTGSQYAFVVTDYLSGKGVEGVEADSGEASALSDKNGKIILTIDQPEDKFDVTLNKGDLRQEKLQINADNKAERPVKMVPARKQVFISKRSGKYDVYKIDVDGLNEQKILAGTGSERSDMVLISHPTDEIVALVSTRDNKRNQDGFLLSTLTIIDLSDNTTTSVAQSEQFQVLDWIGDRLIYVQITQGTSAANPKRHRLMSYNYKTGESKEIASSNYFNDVSVIGNKIYYAPSSAYQGNASAGFFKIDADGNNKQTIISEEIWNFFRTSYENIALSADKNWYNYHLGDKATTKLDGQPASLVSRLYVNSPDGKKSLWIDNRDGKGVLLLYDPSSKDDKNLRTQSGLKYPVRWLNNDTVTYRINTEQETADYAISLNGGEPKKIRDVTNTGGVDAWYYY